MLYPELTLQPSSLTAPPRRRGERTAAGRRFAPSNPTVAWYEPDGEQLIALGLPKADWTVASVHPSEERACVIAGGGLLEVALADQGAAPLPFPAGASAQYVGASGLAVLVGDGLTLYDHVPGEPPRALDVVKGTYPGTLAAVAGDVVALVGDDAPCAFFSCRGGRLRPIGQIERESLRVFECFARAGRIHVYGRGGGVDNAVYIPVLVPRPPRTPELQELVFEDAWSQILGPPGDATRWTGSRDYQEVAAGVLANAGVCFVAPDPDAPPVTLVLWFRERFRNVSVLAIPDADVEAHVRTQLDALDRREGAATDQLLGTLEPFWGCVLGQVLEASQARPVRLAARLSHVVRVRGG